MSDDESALPASSVGGSDQASSPQIAPEVLKSAFNAFKKRWKLTQLDHDSRIGRSPMSSGQTSSLAGIRPPDQFPREVWDELVRVGKLKNAGSGLYARA